jgi:transcriptional regulator with XRE-family HTH domain
MASFGNRLKAERIRLGLTQTAMAELGGVRANAQLGYEKDNSSPSAEYLANLVKHGLDINFMFHGDDLAVSPPQQVAELLSVVTQLPPAHQATGFAVLALLRNLADGTEPATQATDIWRAVRLFSKFLRMSPGGKVMVETASNIE